MKRVILLFLLLSALYFPFVLTLRASAEETPSLTIDHQGSAQVEIISSKGTRVLVDVYNHELLSAPATAKDILLTTHGHPDHLDEMFYPKFPGKQLFCAAGEIIQGDVRIKAIASSHNTLYGPIDPQSVSNFIFLIEMDGLRIAHFGDIGQAEFLPEQLNVLGQIDVAITQLSNSFSSMNMVNKKGFNLMNQLKPRLIIPTHCDLEAAKYAATVWKCSFSEKALRLHRGNIPGETQLVFAGESDRGFAKVLNLPNSAF